MTLGEIMVCANHMESTHNLKEMIMMDFSIYEIRETPNNVKRKQQDLQAKSR